MKSSASRYWVFLGKEITESIRTKRLLVLACVFIILTIIGVLMARYAGEIIAALMRADGATQMVIEMPPPVWTDSYAQLYSGLTEMGMIGVIMLFMGIILREKNSGTIDLIFAKGLSPASFVLAKFTVAGIALLLVLLASIFVAYGYTMVLFEYAGRVGDVLMGGVSFGVFLLMMLAIVMLWSAVAKSTAISAVLGLASFFAIMLLDFIPVVGRFMPASLMSHAAVLSAGESYTDMAIHVLVAAAVIAVSLAMTTQILKKREG